MWFNTFDDVVKKYEATKVIKSTRHSAEQDIRPIGARNRKWERIIKYDDNTYGLTESSYNISIWDKPSAEEVVNDKYGKDMSPILWERKKDGDYITIRNGVVGSAHISRYKFMDMYLPSGMRLDVNRGRQHIMMRNGIGYELPKTKYRVHYSTRAIAHEDDGMKLCFKVIGVGEYERVGDPLPITTTTIDKEYKKLCKPITDKFYEWACTMLPMIDSSWQSRDIYANQIKDWGLKNKITPQYWRMRLDDIPREVGLHIMESDDHEMRIPLAVMMDEHLHIKDVKDKDEVKRMRARYNTCINHLLKVYKIEVN